MDKYQDYLAARVLHENNVVSYRMLSRALKVHVDVAKQMLFEFHRKQTAKKPGCVHATYLLAGLKNPPPSQESNGVEAQDGEDSIMQSSPFVSSLPENGGAHEEETLPVLTITLAREADLEGAKAEFSELLSIQVYSLQPSPAKDLDVLITCNQEVASKYSTDDPLERWKTYGNIRNQNAKRRTLRKAPATSGAAATAKPVTSASKSATSTPSQSQALDAAAPRQQSGAHAGSVGTLTSQPVADVTPSPKADVKKPALKKESSDLFKSFAKAKTKPSKKPAEPEPVQPSAPEDEPMEDASEGENEEQAAEKRRAAEEQRRKQAKAEEELRKMMEEDDDDEVMEDAAEPEEEEELEPPPPPPTKVEPEKIEENVVISEGRRRGRRRVTKKKTVKDEDGYLVTKEELVWESFSEDEPVPQKPKSTPTSSGSVKGKKGGKPGQGSIMNFFQKK